MSLHTTCHVLPITTCPRSVADTYILVLDDAIDPSGTPVIAFCDCNVDTGETFFTTGDAEDVLDEDDILGWIDFRNEAIDPSEKLMIEMKSIMVAMNKRLDGVESLCVAGMSPYSRLLADADLRAKTRADLDNIQTTLAKMSSTRGRH